MGELGQCMHREHGSILRRCSLGRLHRRHLLLREMPIIWCPGACPPPTTFLMCLRAGSPDGSSLFSESVVKKVAECVLSRARWVLRCAGGRARGSREAIPDQFQACSRSIWGSGAPSEYTLGDLFDHRREKLRLLARPPSRCALGAAACKEC